MLPSVVPRLATDSAVRVFPVFGNLSFLDSFPGTELHPYLFCLSFYLLYFFLPPFEDDGLLSWVPLPAFRSCFVEFTQRLNVLLMNLWGRKWSPHPIPPPSSNWAYICLVFNR